MGLLCGWTFYGIINYFFFSFPIEIQALLPRIFMIVFSLQDFYLLLFGGFIIICGEFFTSRIQLRWLEVVRLYVEGEPPDVPMYCSNNQLESIGGEGGRGYVLTVSWFWVIEVASFVCLQNLRVAERLKVFLTMIQTPKRGLSSPFTKSQGHDYPAVAT